MFNIHAAFREVRDKTDAQIQYEEAYRWAARAVVCYRVFTKKGTPGWLVRAKSYDDQARHHAALVRDLNVLRLLGAILEQERLNATRSISNAAR